MVLASSVGAALTPQRLCGVGLAPCQLPSNWRTVNRNRFKAGAISALIAVVSTLVVGLTTAPPASAAPTPECNDANVTARGDTPSGRYVYLPVRNLTGSLYLCWMAKGTVNEGVRALQLAVNHCYNTVPNIATDGIYGEATKAAVRVIQTTHRLKVDGEYGPNTYGVMLFPEFRKVDNVFSGTCQGGI